MDKIEESLAMPGGNVDAEPTDYEKWLDELHKKQDKAKCNAPKNWAPPLFDRECGKRGYHDEDGTLLKNVGDYAKNKNKKESESSEILDVLRKYSESELNGIFESILRESKNNN